MVYTRLSVLPVLFGLVASASAAPLTGPRFAKRQFQADNARDAQALNRKFAGLNANSPCNAGENACINDQFAQCVNGNFVTVGCAGGLICVALPLVNSRGTSITCDTREDAIARIERAGATGGLTGDGSGGGGGQAAPAPDPAPAPAPAPAPPANNNGGGGNNNGGGGGAAPSSGGGATAPASCPKNRKREFFTPRGSTFTKRAAQQDLGAVAQSWQDLCVKSGGNISGPDQPCVTLAGINGINALLAGAPPCAQQNNADAMIDFAKSAGVTNKQALIDNAIAYRKHARNTINLGGFTPSTPFCRTPPRNPELNGVVNEQLSDADPGLFGSPNFPVVAFGAPESCPFGQDPDVATCTCK